MMKIKPKTRLHNTSKGKWETIIKAQQIAFEASVVRRHK